MWSKEKDENNETYYLNLENFAKSKIKPEEGPYIYHILVKHTESRNPTQLSKSKALDFINKLHVLLVDPKQPKETVLDRFCHLAVKYSDCSSKKTGGCIGYVCLKQMIPAFERVAYRLEVGEVSTPIETREWIPHFIQEQIKCLYISCFLLYTYIHKKLNKRKINILMYLQYSIK